MKLRKYRKILNGFVLSSLLVFVAGPATVSAEKPSEECQFQGSWFGYDEQGMAYWVSTADGQSSSHGTYTVEFPGVDFTVGGMFPTAVSWSSGRGVWERTGGYTFAAGGLVLVTDGAENTLYIMKSYANYTLNADCDTMSIVHSIEFFYGNQDPYADTPFYAFYPDPHTGERVRIDPPASP